MTPHFEFTTHAVERFMERHADALPYPEAEAALRELAKGATVVDEVTRRGHALWQIADPPLRFVTKRDGGVDVCVTVLPAGATFGSYAVGDLSADEVMAAYGRATAHVRPKAKTRVIPVAGPTIVEPLPAGLTPREQASLQAQFADMSVRVAAAKKKADSYKSTIATLQASLAAAKKRIAEGGPPGPTLPGPTKLRRQVEHLARMEADRAEARRIVRVAMKALIVRIGEPDVAATLDAISAIAEWPLNPEFWNQP